VPPKSQTSETLSLPLTAVRFGGSKQELDRIRHFIFLFFSVLLRFFFVVNVSFLFNGKEDQKGFSTCLTMLPGNQRIST
jgi:hypothetical protein